MPLNPILLTVCLTTISVAQTLALNEKMKMNSELERTWKKAVMACFKVLAWMDLGTPRKISVRLSGLRDEI
jgi:hypothetical protein